MAIAESRPFLRRFLDAIFAEVALAGGDQRLDLVDRAGLADGDQGREIASSRRLGRALDAVADTSQPFSRGQNLKAVPTYTAWLSRRWSWSGAVRSFSTL